MQDAPVIAEWLRRIGLPQYERAFSDNAVDTESLSELTEADLEKLGVLLGHRKRMLRAIGAAATPQQTAIPPEFLGQLTPPPDATERRQLTMLFCDLVGSTSLAARLDPEDMRTVLAAYYACASHVIDQFGGFVVKYVGDGMLAYFGYPRAREDDTERAVRAGLALVDQIGQLDVPSGRLHSRVGIATGVVVVGDVVGGGNPQDHDVIGEAPNLAARLQALAVADSVLVAASTRQLVGELFEFRDLGAAELKGFAEPQPVWQAVRIGAVDSRFDALRASSLTSLVGREEEVELLLRRWQQAKRGDGQIVLLTGEAGIGKSRVTRALEQELQDEPHSSLRYFCSPHHRDSTLHPFIAQLERAAGFMQGDLPAAKLDKLAAMVAQADGGSADATALFADLLALPRDERFPAPTADPQHQRELTLVALAGQLDALAHQQPVLVVLEDAHWIDSTSRELLDIVVERIPRLPALLVITCRPDFAPPWIGQPRVMMLSLSRLDNVQAATLVQQVADNRQLPCEILDQVLKRADGIPLFIEEMTKTLLESGLLREQDGRLILDGQLPPLAIPSSLHASLLARLDRLGEFREVAQIGAILGREFSYELLSAVGGQTTEQLDIALDQLTRAGLLFRRGLGPRASFIFKHALVQDAAYSTLLRGQRRTLHERVGKALEEQFPETVLRQPEILAHHFTQAGLIDRAIEFWHMAGKQALRRSAHAEGVTHLTRAIQLVSSLAPSHERDRRELGLHLTLGQLIRATSGYAAPEAFGVFSRARELLDDTATVQEHMTVLYGLWSVHYVRAEHSASHAVARECLMLAARHQDRDATALANMLLGHSLWATGTFIEARHHLEQTRQLCATGTQDEAGSRFLGNNGIAALSYLACVLWPLGYPDSAIAAAQHAVALARVTRHVALIAFAAYIEVFLDGLLTDHHTPTTTQADDVVAYCVENRVRAYEHWVRFCQGNMLVRRGDPRHGIEVMERAMAEAETIDAKLFRPVHLGHLAVAYARLEQPEIAVGLLDEAIQIPGDTGERFFEAELYRLRGEVLLQIGRTDQGERDLQRALAVACDQNAKLWELRAVTSISALWRTQGKSIEARKLLEPILAWFSEGLTTMDVRRARTLMEELR